MRRSHTALALAALCLAVVLQAVPSMRQKSLTYDELAYVPAGATYVETGDFRLNQEQPPLMKLLAGLAMAPLDPQLPLEAESWTSALEVGNTQWEFGRAFLEANPDRERLVFAARLPTVLIHVLLVLGAFLLARELYGPAAGLLAAGLSAFDPNLLAHGRLATTDLALACFVLWTVWAVRRLVLDPRPRWMVAAGVVLALALLAKFSGLFLLGLLPLWAVALALLPERPGEGGGGDRHGPLPATAGFSARPLPHLAGRPPAHRVGWALAGAAAVMAVAVVLVSFAYLEPGRVDRYFRDFFMVNVNVQPAFRTYFAGTFHDGRVWYYFLAAFLLKTPLAFLVLLAGRAVDHLRHPVEGRAARILLLAPVAVWLLVISWKAYQIGIRYVLPVYPLLFVWTAGLLASPLLRRGWARGATALLVAWFAGSSLLAHPHYLPYANAVAGGSDGVIRWLDDSNVDWGQDLILLRAWMEAEGEEHVFVTPMAEYDPALYGVPGTFLPPHEALPALGSVDPPPGLYAVSAHLLNRARLDPRLRVDPLTERTPRVVLGHTIWVFDLR